MKVNKKNSKSVTITFSHQEAETLINVLIPNSMRPMHSLVRDLVKSLTPPEKVRTKSHKEAVEALEATAGFFQEQARRTSNSATRRLAEGDADDLFELARRVKKGHFISAKNLAASLDTAVRDEIPRVAWPFVGLVPLR